MSIFGGINHGGSHSFMEYMSAARGVEKYKKEMSSKFYDLLSQMIDMATDEERRIAWEKSYVSSSALYENMPFDNVLEQMHSWKEARERSRERSEELRKRYRAFFDEKRSKQ